MTLGGWCSDSYSVVRNGVGGYESPLHELMHQKILKL